MEKKGLHNMTMKITSGIFSEENPSRKRMYDMTRGEVCYLENVGYILRVGACSGSLFLILGDDVTCDHYDITASKHHDVRKLFKNESVTINFK